MLHDEYAEEDTADEFEKSEPEKEAENISITTMSSTDVESIAPLEGKVNSLLGETSPAATDANLSLVKLYQFHPERLNKDILSKVLVRSLMNLPSNDLQLILYLLPEKQHAEEPTLTVVRLSNHLERAQYAKFWEATKGAQELLSSVPNFHTTVREFISSMITLSHRTIRIEQLEQVLGLSKEQSNSYIQEKGWSNDNGAISLGSVDQTQTKKMSQNVKFDDLSRILKTLNK
ncbi:eukaryotic translation initiation factor 3, subunit 12 [Planoprotostelium fungivorum]|uniref:Eukaryotic translation initiation factor 3 subunit K n=1 Tax=Planoprotostelium fungivorum TaxID=1890364 RepID=A0A2P6NFZ5_9EUKA|nr:eukaryotic translation initiation factor 3, subunit 12 [Planoprotostelium fungivorum]